MTTNYRDAFGPLTDGTYPKGLPRGPMTRTARLAFAIAWVERAPTGKRALAELQRAREAARRDGILDGILAAMLPGERDRFTAVCAVLAGAIEAGVPLTTPAPPPVMTLADVA